MSTSTRASTDRRLIVLALLTVYIVWGSTYLAIRFMVEDFPPLFGNAIRMIVAGSILFWLVYRRTKRMPTAVEWRNGMAIGALLFVGGLGLVSTTEDMGVGSGLVATAIAMTPVWASLAAGFFGQWPTRTEWLGLAVGLIGVAVLSREGDFQSQPVGFVLVLIAPMLWAAGSVWSRHITMAPGAMVNALQMLGGAVGLTLAGLVRGESIDGMPSAGSWLALLYLIVPGSLLAFSAYGYLLRTVRPALATSYGYVNPIVAVVLGVWLGGEVISGPLWIALPLVVVAVVLIAGAHRVAGQFDDPSVTPENEGPATV
jgi:drug/metabolite transporter (DMT)-like permease